MSVPAGVSVKQVRAAETYHAADDLWLVTCYFNPAGYESRRRNYDAFAERIVESGLHLLTVECAFRDDPFVLPHSSAVLQIRASDVLWQKERLLNLAISRLPPECSKVAWLDCDILFENPAWAVETSRMLDDVPLLQPFDTGIRLPRDRGHYDGQGDVWRSFGNVCAVDPGSAGDPSYERHGATGLAWAGRRELLARCGLYDACIVGGGDHAMAHAMCGNWTLACVDGLMGEGTARWQRMLQAVTADRGEATNPHLKHFLSWGRTFFSHVRGKVGFVSGGALHLWHGEPSNRRHPLRHRELRRFGFDPRTDVKVGPTGCWEWASDKPEMHRAVADYFFLRDEDGFASSNHFA